MNGRAALAVFAVLACGALSVFTDRALAQTQAKVFRIGYLSSAPGPGPTTESFIAGLRELGFVEGRNYIIEYRWAALKNERLPDLANDLVRAKVDLIVTADRFSTTVAQQATRTIPIVFGAMGAPGAPVERGIATSLARPGGNITGLAWDIGVPETLQLLKAASPTLSRVGFLYDPAAWPAQAPGIVRERMNVAAKPLGVTMQWVPVRDANDVERAFGELDKGTNGLLLEGTPSVFSAREQICRLALQRKLPSVGYVAGQADAGCLIGYGQNFPDMRRRAAAYVVKILKGARPGDLPIEQPQKFDLVVNLDTAAALGLAIPPNLLAQAGRTIKLGAEPKRAGKSYRIGTLSLADRSDEKHGLIIAKALQDRGYALDSIAWVSRLASGRPERLPELAADLVRQKVDIILTAGASETLAAAKATAAIPIVFFSPLPVELGLVKSLARPGGNVTGMSADVDPETVGKLVEVLKQVLPNLSRMATVWNPDRPEDRIYEKALREANRVLRVESKFVNVRAERDLDAAFDSITRERAEAILVALDPNVVPNIKRLTAFALKRGLPTISYDRTLVDEGGLMSYGPKFDDMLRSLAVYIDKILKGAKPADLPVEQPTTFQLVVNLKTAKALGLTIPQSVIVRADEVIQ